MQPVPVVATRLIVPQSQHVDQGQNQYRQAGADSDQKRQFQEHEAEHHRGQRGHHADHGIEEKITRKPKGLPLGIGRRVRPGTLKLFHENLEAEINGVGETKP